MTPVRMNVARGRERGLGGGLSYQRRRNVPPIHKAANIWVHCRAAALARSCVWENRSSRPASKTVSAMAAGEPIQIDERVLRLTTSSGAAETTDAMSGRINGNKVIAAAVPEKNKNGSQKR